MAKHVRNTAPAVTGAREAPIEEDFGRRMASQARQLFDDEFSQRVGRSASNLNRLADALRGAAARLEGSSTARHFESAAGQVERIAALVKNANGRDLIDGLQSFARRRPLLFLGTAVAVGIGAGRFLKSSTPATPATPALLPSNTRARTTASAHKSNDASQMRGMSHE